jgi:myo-inositol-1(or 4)-monophosphatase
VKDDFLITAVKAARLAGKVILDNLGKISGEDIHLKMASDFVTRVDTESEQVIMDTIRDAFPHHIFLAEESLKEVDSEKYRWIIDPLDGTTNFIHQYPVICVSIALEYQREIILGVIFDPLRAELFTAEKGRGAYLNDRRLRVSAVQDKEHSLITTGFPFRRKELIDPYLKLFRNVFLRVGDLRRAGSAALDLAYLACGRCEGFFEIGLGPWDIAAGDILIREAGGAVTDFGGGGNYLLTGNIVAGTPLVHEMLLKEAIKAFAGIIDK